MARTLETFFGYYDNIKKIVVKVSQPSYDAILKDNVGGYPVYGVTKDGEFRRVREYVVVPGNNPIPLGGLPPKKEFIKK
jgi:hypothetical protein